MCKSFVEAVEIFETMATVDKKGEYKIGPSEKRNDILQPFFNNFVIIFFFILTLYFYSISIVLIFVSIPHFLCKL